MEEWVIRLPVPFRVGNSDVLFTLFDELLPQPVLELRRSATCVVKAWDNRWFSDPSPQVFDFIVGD